MTTIHSQEELDALLQQRLLDLQKKACVIPAEQIRLKNELNIQTDNLEGLLDMPPASGSDHTMIRDRIQIVNEARRELYRLCFSHSIERLIAIQKMIARQMADEEAFWKREAERERAEGSEESAKTSDQAADRARQAIRDAKREVERLLDLRRGDLSIEDFPNLEFNPLILIDPTWDRSNAEDIRNNIDQFRQWMLDIGLPQNGDTCPDESEDSNDDPDTDAEDQ